MLSLKDKIVFITGASSGIGKACAEQFAAQGAKLILSARRIDKLDTLATELKNKNNVDVLAIPLDVRDKDQVNNAVQQLPDGWNKIDILINNAGLALASDKIQEGDTNNWDIMIDTNIRGLLYVTHAILPNMVARNSGHIVNIGSISGRDIYPVGNVYCATKFAVKALSKSMRIDLLGKAIRVTEIAPGAVATEFSEVRWQDRQRADEFYGEFTALKAEDIADSVLYATTRPAHVDVAEMVIYPTVQATVNHVHKDLLDKK